MLSYLIKSNYKSLILNQSNYVNTLNRYFSSFSYKASSNIRVMSQEEQDRERYKKQSAQIGPTEDEVNEENFYGVFRSSKILSPELDYIYRASKRSFTWKDPVGGFKSMLEKTQRATLLIDQKYIDERMEVLGFDLGAAYFVIYRKGKIKFKGIKDWVKIDMKTEKPTIQIPHFYSPDYIVEEIDLSGLPILYDALLSLDNLYELKAINFSKCPFFTDWCIDRLCGQVYTKLEHLDISYCPLITECGISQLSKLRSLKTLNVEGLTNVDDLQLLCLMLEDCTPNLEIKGVPFD